jgi:hypothetical protein
MAAAAWQTWHPDFGPSATPGGLFSALTATKGFTKV